MKIGENSKSEQINNQLSVSEQQSSSKMKIKNTSHQTISLGNTAFASIREANSFYIDKTDFIRQWWESQDVATLITRPRRFGKSLNLNMLECFFSEKYRGEGELFRGLSIWNHEKYREIQGTYPVIFFSFADIKGQTFTSAREAICQVIQDLYAEFGFLKESERLSQEEKDYFHFFGCGNCRHRCGGCIDSKPSVRQSGPFSRYDEGGISTGLRKAAGYGRAG